MACKCQGCGAQYSVDIIVPDDLWAEIRPAHKVGQSGLLCSFCIMVRIEHLCQDGPEFGPNKYGAWVLASPPLIKFAEKCAKIIEALPDLKSHPDLIEAYKDLQAGKPNR